MRRRAATSLLLMAVGLAVAGTTVVAALHAAAASASTAPPLGVYSLIGDATGAIVSEDEPSANAHPEGQGSIPEASTLLTNGPVGYSLSAVGWPGATEGNAGGLVILLFPGPVGNVTPVPDAVTASVDSAAPLTNYPARAEARAGSHPDASYTAPGVGLTSHADTANVTADAVVQGAQQPGQASYGNMHTQSASTLNANTGRVTASSTVSNINIAGVVKIGSVTSTATAQTDGATSFGAGSTIVSNMTIGGQPAYVDGNGVHMGKPGAPANAVTDQVANQALGGAGVKFTTSNPSVVTQGASTTYTAGSLIVLWTPPGDPSGNVFTASFGGARALVNGAPASAFPTASAPVVPPPVTPPSADVVPTPDATVTPSAPTAPSAPAPTTAPSPTSSPPAATPLAAAPFQPAAAHGFRGVGAGLIAVGLAGVGLLFAGSRRLATDLLDRPTGTCPLERMAP